MYVPPSFAENDVDRLQAFIEQHSFATLVSLDTEAGPLANHLPLLIDRDCGSPTRLMGHMARANPQWKTAAGQRVLAIFHGPHAYISPSWYEAQNVVPTWNYLAVHAYGTLHLIHERDRLCALLRRTVEQYESHMPQPWTMDASDAEFTAQLLQAIVGFEIELDRIEGKWKLSQNHDAERRQKVIRGLYRVGGHGDRQIAEFMAIQAATQASE